MGNTVGTASQKVDNDSNSDGSVNPDDSTLPQANDNDNNYDDNDDND